MTWPAAIAAALGLTTLALLLINQHRSTPRTTTPRRTENDRDQDQNPQAPHRRPEPPQNHGSA